MSEVVSSFEILVKPIAPAPPFQGEPSRTVVQAYFLLISNISTTGAELTLSLKFTAEGAPLADDRLITLFDAGAGNVFGKLDSGVADNLVFEPGATGLFILQPDLRKPEVLPASPSDANLEVRGFVEVDISANSSSNSARILVNPQIRGTFLSGSMPPDFDQQAYSLLTPNGGSLVTL